MTRINAGIRPQELPNKLLLAELREIKRIPNCVKKGRYSIKGQPDKFTLGKGHVKFFYDKQLYLAFRYSFLYLEALSRGLNCSWFGDAWEDIPEEMNGWYIETKEARQEVLDRIHDKGFKLINECVVQYT